MRELANQLRAAIADGRPVACCRLVETRGSTPQKPGAAMLVFADGEQAGTLGGGCVEAEVKRRALAALADGAARIERFQLDDDYGWDDGLICGGRMHVLVEPLADEATRAYYLRLADLASGEGGTEAIVFDAAAADLPATASYLFAADGHLVAHARGPLDDGRAPERVRRCVVNLSSRPRATAAHGVASLPLVPRCCLVIVGGGHVGAAVANLAYDLDFDVWVVDDRAEYVSAERFPRATRRIVGPIGATLRELEITPRTYCLIVTRGHNHDEEALYHLAQRGAAYVGMIGSRRKIRLIFDDLAAEGVAAKALAHVFAPVGFNIGSQTVAEIAVSIAAELVAHRNAGLRRAPPAEDAAATTEAGEVARWQN